MEQIGAVGLGDDGEASGEVASAGEASDGEVPAQLGTDGCLGIPKKYFFLIVTFPSQSWLDVCYCYFAVKTEQRGRVTRASMQ